MYIHVHVHVHIHYTVSIIAFECSCIGMGDWLLSGSRGSVVSVLAFESLILTSILGQKLVFRLCKLTIDMYLCQYIIHPYHEFTHTCIAEI